MGECTDCGIIAKRSAVLPEEWIALCDSGLAQDDSSHFLGSRKSPQTIWKNCVLVVNMSLRQKRLAGLALLGGSPTGQLPSSVFTLTSSGCEAGLGLERRAESRK